MVRRLHRRTGVNWGSESASTRIFEDGLGVRRVETDPRDGSTIEVLDVSPALAAQAGFEDAIRARVEWFAKTPIDGVAAVRRVERDGSSLRVVADHVEGLRLPDLLHEAVKGNAPLPQAAALELAGRIIRIVSALHQAPGLSHGSITPAHVVVTRKGRVVLTDAVFGSAIEGLQRNREQLWREFRLALPSSASLPRFDQRADVAQLGATILAVTLGRSLRADEYPRATNDVVIAATLAARPGETGTAASALRMWLQQALYLHPRATMATAIDAERAFDDVLGPVVARRGGATMFVSAVRQVFGDTPAAAEAAQVAAAWSAADGVAPAAGVIHPVEPLPDPIPAGADTPRPLTALFRSVFPIFRTS